jgi:hypothetical protein
MSEWTITNPADDAENGYTHSPLERLGGILTGYDHTEAFVSRTLSQNLGLLFGRFHYNIIIPRADQTRGSRTLAVTPRR